MARINSNREEVEGREEMGEQTKAEELREVIAVLKEEAPDNWQDLLLNLVKVDI